MKSTSYSEKTLDHFRNPRNVGMLEGDDVAVGRVGNPVCGDIMEMYLRIKDDRIAEIKFQTFGCGSAVATSSMTTELVKGMTLDEALEVTRKDVAEALDGLPPIKMHCSNLAADALHDAIKNWRAGIHLEPTIAEETEIPLGGCDVPGLNEIEHADDYAGIGVYKTGRRHRPSSKASAYSCSTRDRRRRSSLSSSPRSRRGSSSSRSSTPSGCPRSSSTRSSAPTSRSSTSRGCCPWAARVRSRRCTCTISTRRTSTTCSSTRSCCSSA